MSLQETFYSKFNDEISRQRFMNKVVLSPYYLSHYTYEREGADTMQYMLVTTMGNYFDKSSVVLGEHVPVPCYDEHEE